MKGQRVKAFTIMEVTITMLIAAILMAITYTTYSIVSRSYLSFNTKNKNMAELQQLDKLLKRDFDRAENIQKISKGIQIENTRQVITYEFNPDFIVRTALITDTFKVKTDSLNMSFEGQSAGEQSRLDELSFTLVFQKENIPYHYYKQYSSVNLIQTESNAVN
jgi:prepilin-type N-terminal cleavage/methylation domain-containing protein